MEARNDKLKKAMFYEFNECTDARIRQMTRKTSNYGCHGFGIDLETEWQFAACPISVPETKKYSVQTGNKMWDEKNEANTLLGGIL